MESGAKNAAHGPLQGVTILEFAGSGPGPFAAMMLADHGADVIRIERPGVRQDPFDVMGRSRKLVTIDAKSEQGKARIEELARGADALIDVFRPGTMERLGLGPDVLLAANPRLIYARMTGWGQSGPFAPYAGHDINYIAISGALHTIGRVGGPPIAPPGLIGDLGGGGMMLAFAIIAAILHARVSGRGQVVDCAMCDGAAVMMAAFYGAYAAGTWRDERGVNIIDGGAHFYDVYETSDGRHITVGALEPQFYVKLLELTGLDRDAEFAAQNDRKRWPMLKERLATLFRTRSQADWCAIFEQTDACFAPVLGLADAPRHPHNVARATFIEQDGIVQPAPAPRYSATPLPRPRRSEPLDGSD